MPETEWNHASLSKTAARGLKVNRMQKTFKGNWREGKIEKEENSTPTLPL